MRFQQFSNSKPHHLSRRRGIVFVEFALILPIFVFLLLGVLQYARLVQATEAVTNLSREGARYASLGSGQTNAEITDFIEEQVRQTNLNPDDFQFAITPSQAERLQGAEISVTLTYDLRSRIFLPGNPFMQGLLNSYRKSDGIPRYDARAVMRIVNE